MREQPIRVLHLLNSLTGSGCGIVNAAMDMIAGQLQQDEVEVAVCAKPGEYRSVLEARGVRVYELNQRRSVSHLWRAVVGLNRVIREFRPDVIHCHMVTGIALTRLLQPFYRFKIVGHLHNVHQQSSDLMRFADLVIVVSHAVGADMVKRGIPARKIRVVQNGTLGSFRLADAHEEDPKPLLQKAIVTVGGMNHRKGIAELISAFEQVSARIPGCHLYLVGNGPDCAKFEQQARASSVAAQVHFEGFQPNPIPYMKAASVFVLASRRDSFPLVLPEARACGCAIVATNVDGIPEALDGGEAGLLVPPQDIERLAQALTEMLGSSGTADAFRKRAVENLDRFTVTRLAAEILTVYREATTSRQSRRKAQSLRVDSEPIASTEGSVE